MGDFYRLPIKGQSTLFIFTSTQLGENWGYLQVLHDPNYGKSHIYWGQKTPFIFRPIQSGKNGRCLQASNQENHAEIHR